MGSVILIDQVLKSALLAALPDGHDLRIGSMVRIRPVRNRGTLATRLGVPTGLLVVAWLAILVGAAVAAVRTGIFDSPLSWVALGAALGGAASNLLDHFVRGGVVDYVDLRVWPAFNLADAAIVGGALGALVAG